MIKLQSFLVRRDDMTHEEFRDYWLTEHVPLARELPGLRRYRTAVPVDPARSRYDGIAELYFDTIEEFDVALGPNSNTEAIQDVDNFEKRTDRCLVVETVHYDELSGNRRNLKLVAVVTQGDDLSHETSFNECLDGLVEQFQGLRKYTTAIPVDPGNASYDRVIEWYFDNRSALEAALYKGESETSAATVELPINGSFIGHIDGHVVEEFVQLDEVV